jgi:peptide/nickel transport system permease protein
MSIDGQPTASDPAVPAGAEVAAGEVAAAIDPDAATLAGAGDHAAAVAPPTDAELTATRDEAKRARQAARRESWRLLRRRPSFLIGSGILLFWIVCAVGGTGLAPRNPLTPDPFFGHAPPGSKNGTYLLGTDKLGRDILSRVIVGAREVLTIAPLAAALGVAAGTLLGLMMGYYRGLVDDLLSRLVEAFLSLPVTLVGLLALVAVGPSPFALLFVVGGLFTPIVARTVRAATLSERELDYVQAARLQGESSLYIMVREILPNITGPIIVEFTVRVGFAVFTLSTLSFLGVGIQPPTPDWGLIISDEYGQVINGYWWPVLFPSLAIASLVVAVNLIADALQGVLER